jgi:hypothetical protein
MYKEIIDFGAYFLQFRTLNKYTCKKVVRKHGINIFLFGKIEQENVTEPFINEVMELMIK